MAQILAKVMTLALGAGLSGSMALAEGNYHGYETPLYSVAQTDGAFELRDYAPFLTAQVTVRADRQDALRKGFQVLAGYIFGGNTSADKVEMTSPVSQTASEKIAMTSPVGQAGADGLWTVSFMMPRSYTVATLPVPRDDAIRFVESPAERQVVVRFSGLAGESVLAQQEALLRAYALAQGLAIEGAARYYFYDDPFTLPWRRRNEVALVVQ
jgi:hypothetical protein